MVTAGFTVGLTWWLLQGLLWTYLVVYCGDLLQGLLWTYLVVTAGFTVDLFGGYCRVYCGTYLVVTAGFTVGLIWWWL